MLVLIFSLQICGPVVIFTILVAHVGVNCANGSELVLGVCDKRK